MAYRLLLAQFKLLGVRAILSNAYVEPGAQVHVPTGSGGGVLIIDCLFGDCLAENLTLEGDGEPRPLVLRAQR